MAAALAHRGPDGQAVWLNKHKYAGLAHRRLCVIDTSEAAAQPMHLADRYTIVYNGEIYNYREIKENLTKEGFKFRTQSDTEVILFAYARYGEQCVDLFDGMFAFAIWDDEEQTLFCARDRFGEKPFYYVQDEANSAFLFASEMKALYAAGVPHMDNHPLHLAFLTLGYTTDPERPEATFDARIKKLPAAHTLTHTARSGLNIRRYWSLKPEQQNLTLEKAAERLKELLTLSVERRLRSDVTLGTSLSGGLDSSSILAIMHEVGGKPAGTFTAAFPGFHKDESAKAAAVAARFSSKHYLVAPDVEGLVADFGRLLYYQEEPFTSAGVYAQFRVFELAAARGVTVLLDGQGADETLAGYDKYRQWWVRTLAPSITARMLERKARTAIIHNRDIEPGYLNAYAGKITIRKPIIRQLNDLLFYETVSRGLEELLRYADRNAMAHGREVRLPFLNHDLVEFVFGLPGRFKIGHGYTKLVLRQAMRLILPGDIVWNKRKTGFEPPQRDWMKHALVLDLRQEAIRSLVEKGILKKEALYRAPRAHEAYESDSKEWRWLVAGGLLLLNKKGV